MNHNESLMPQFTRVQTWAKTVGIVGIVLMAVGAVFARSDFFQSYLFGYLFWLWLSLGCLGILLLHHLVSGSWGHVIQRFLESGARTLPLMAILFIPVLLGMNDLYPWTSHKHLEHAVAEKSAYLNVPFFIIRQIIFFGLWITMALWLSRQSRLQDENADPKLTRMIKIFSGPSMVFFVLTVTLASVDWMMSLEPEWYSTMYGIGRISGATLGCIAFSIVMIRFLGNKKPLVDVLSSRHLHHLGNLLMAFTIFWAYIAFSEFLIIWSGNLPEDNMWHLRRMNNGWNILAAILILGHFAVPFALLLSKSVKRRIEPLARIAIGILVMRLVDIYWLVYPAFNGHQFRFHWLTIVAPLAIGAVWIWMFVNYLKRQPLLPLHDPRFHNGMAEQH